MWVRKVHIVGQWMEMKISLKNGNPRMLKKLEIYGQILN
jgi:hypothetical protein